MTVVVIGDNTGNDFSGTIDSWLSSYFNGTNFSANETMEATKYGVGDHSNSVIAFTGLSNIPAGATITGATLSLYLSDAGGTSNTVTLKRILRNWVEGQVTWNEYSSGNAWTSGGAISDGNDRSATVTASLAINTTHEYKVFSDAQLIADIQAIVDGGSNYGWTIERTDGQDDANYRIFVTSEGANGQRPYLTITYTAGGGATAPPTNSLSMMGMGI